MEVKYHEFQNIPVDTQVWVGWREGNEDLG